MLNEELLKILACPGCKGDLEYQKEENKLICRKCCLKFKIQEDIPIMLLDQAERF
ncbi:MAG: tetraacyldisaccharide 4'-kinase [candidate division Zixibacteria bacterium RBG_16_40_9]|nr:MAG: tetraacyldisaccharide 4'-kinase [candidate division Zixibacteria bacterium RBG_16_40_9]